MAAPYTYAIGPVVEQDGCYVPPTGCISWIDLRSLAQQSALGQLGYGFFTMPVDWTVPSGYHGLGGGTGDLRSLYFSAADQSAWAALIGTTIPRDASTTVMDALRLQLTDYSDPDGASGPKTLAPGTPPPGPPPAADIYLAGHSRVWRGTCPMLGAAGWGDRYRQLMRADLLRFANETARGRHPEKWRAVLGAMKEKHGIKWDDPNENDFLPPQLRGRYPSDVRDPPSKRKKAVKPETRYDENFDGADKSGVGYQLTWTEVAQSGDSSNTSNALRWDYGGSGSPYGRCRAEHDLSSSDHYAGCNWVSANTGGGAASDNRAGGLARYSASDDTCYYYEFRNGTSTDGLYKIVTGTVTGIGGNSGASISLPDDIRTHANGSAIAGYLNGVIKGSAITDTAISSGTRWGVGARTGATLGRVVLDDAYAEDLSGGGGGGSTPSRLMLLGVG